VLSCGSSNLYYDAELAYRRERIQRDFAAINSAGARSGGPAGSSPAPPGHLHPEWTRLAR